MLETHHKKLPGIHLYDGVDEKGLELDALQKCKVSVSKVPVFLVEVNAALKTIL